MEKNQVTLKFNKHVGFFIEGVDEFILIFRQYFLKKKCFKYFFFKSRTTFYSLFNSFENLKYSKRYSRGRQAADEHIIQCMCLACCITKCTGNHSN